MSKPTPTLLLKIAIAALLVFHPVNLPAQQASGTLFTGAPSEQLAAARARLHALGSYRERRNYSEPTTLRRQVIEFSGSRQRWISEFKVGDKATRQETIWEGGRSATRSWPDHPGWQCWPPIDEKYIEPPTTVRLGPALEANGHAARQFVEEFINQTVGSKVVAEVDVDIATGLPVRVTHTETASDHVTKYVGEYFDVGALIEIVFPRC